jgi:hypothetical protein
LTAVSLADSGVKISLTKGRVREERRMREEKGEREGRMGKRDG